MDGQIGGDYAFDRLTAIGQSEEQAHALLDQWDDDCAAQQVAGYEQAIGYLRTTFLDLPEMLEVTSAATKQLEHSPAAAQDFIRQIAKKLRVTVKL